MSGGFFALLDDIASVMYKTSAAVLKTTSASVNTMASATKMTVNGISPHHRAAHEPLLTPEREIPVVLRIAKNSALNKLWIIPAVVLINVLVPFLLVPVLMLGGTRLCCEGAEKWLEKFSKTPAPQALPETMPIVAPGMTQSQKEDALVKSVSTTDKVMSLEWGGFSLQEVAHAAPMQQLVHAGVSGFWMTVGVYGLVIALVKADDIGLHCSQKKGEGLRCRIERGFGRSLLKVTPWIMKNVSNGGTIAMMSVGGDLLVKGIPLARDLSHHISQNVVHSTLQSLPIPFVASIAAGFATLAFSTAVGAGVGVGVTLANRRYGPQVKQCFQSAAAKARSPIIASCMRFAASHVGNQKTGVAEAAFPRPVDEPARPAFHGKPPVSASTSEPVKAYRPAP